MIHRSSRGSSQPGWTLARTFVDQASGATLERPALAQALTEVRAGRYDLLLVYRVDRLACSVRGPPGGRAGRPRRRDS